MAMFVLSFFIYLAVQSATAQECKIGRSLVDDFQLQEVTESWKWVYLNQKDILGGISCALDNIHAHDDGGVHTVCSYIDNSDGRNISFRGTIEKSGGNLVFTYPEEYNEWNGSFKVLAIEPGRYLILGICASVLNEKPLVAILFTSWTPSDDDMNAAKEALSETGNDFKNFYLFCPLSDL